jgi:dTDP-4-dehydrorhamnose 3,5-epimerase
MRHDWIMKFQPLGIQGAWLVESEVFEDDRGSFREWFKSEEIKNATGIDFSATQANVSSSKKGVIRGIHFSVAPGGQAKWVTCTFGRILDVIVDIRPNSSTYKKVEYVDLNGATARATLIEEGLGHGFISLEENSIVSYLLSSPYAPNFELGINPFDKDLGIAWPSIDGEISDKDKSAKTLEQLQLLGLLPKGYKIA